MVVMTALGTPAGGGAVFARTRSRRGPQDDELELAARCAPVKESVSGKAEQDIWLESAQKFVRHAIALLRETDPPGEPPTFVQIAELASNLEALSRIRSRFLAPARKEALRTHSPAPVCVRTVSIVYSQYE